MGDQEMRLLFPVAGLAVMAMARLAMADSDVILTTTVNDVTRSFTLEELQALPVERFETITIWTEGPQSFEGVPLAAMLDDLGVTEGTVSAQAINDYAVDIPIDEITETTPIIAYHQNGASMSRRDKGPLWIVYPYDSKPEFQSEAIYSRSIWQMDRLSVK
ncbi:molybdopterin-dependent oxidoreductase [Salipiger sp. 1_MG-2023]|uniref:molybdopterin-dependent oxidoreductase n=1 Tax=Salipiger sp. 1_MG-2023 TaxID=3062665 RepID=UPI0026E2CAD1|nr:molybdopterin-dependent oxidoreductase [Salipiger sp. 1_MG-2023]MDO6587799.1 molybdopterin-dependent oxidoreductase [Salipiger sp. 1_MG-2023]